MKAILPTSKGINIGNNIDKGLRQGLGQKSLKWHLLLAWLIIIFNNTLSLYQSFLFLSDFFFFTTPK